MSPGTSPAAGAGGRFFPISSIPIWPSSASIVTGTKRSPCIVAAVVGRVRHDPHRKGAPVGEIEIRAAAIHGIRKTFDAHEGLHLTPTFVSKNDKITSNRKDSCAHRHAVAHLNLAVAGQLEIQHIAAFELMENTTSPWRAAGLI